MSLIDVLARARRAVASLAFVLVLGLLHAGCNDSDSGHPVGPGQPSNFSVTNRDIDTLHVYVDGGEIGDVRPGATVEFWVDPGSRLVQFRETGQSTRDDQGVFTFSTSTTISLIHDPSTPNLRVINDAVRTVHVYVDATEVGTVSPFTTAEWNIVPGTHDVYFRETGQARTDYYDTYTFGTSVLIEITYR